MSLTNMDIAPNGARLADKLAVVVIDFRQWTGTRVLVQEDFRLGVGGQLPPENVIHDLGSKCICDPQDLKVFVRLKRRAERLLANHGVPFMGAMAIPLEKSHTVLSALNDIADEFNRARDEFLVDYDRRLATWLAENPTFAQQLHPALLSKKEVQARIYAKYYVFKVSPLAKPTQGNGQSGDRFIESETALGETLLNEIAKEASSFYLRSFAGRDSVMTKTLEKVRKWRERLQGLRFLNKRIQPVIDDLDRTLALMPVSGRIEGEAFYRLSTLVLALADSRRTEALCEVLEPSVRPCRPKEMAGSLDLCFDDAPASETPQDPEPSKVDPIEAEMEAFEAFLSKFDRHDRTSEASTDDPSEGPLTSSTLKDRPSIGQHAPVSFW